MNNEGGSQTWYYRSWFVVLMLIWIFPIGLFLMWKANKFNLYIRVGVSFVFLVMMMTSILTSAMGGGNTSPKNSSNPAGQTKHVADAKVVPDKVDNRKTGTDNKIFTKSQIVCKNAIGDMLNGFKIKDIEIKKGEPWVGYEAKVAITLENTTGINYRWVTFDMKGWDANNVQVLADSYSIMSVDAGQIVRYEAIIAKKSDSDKNARTIEFLDLKVMRR